MYNFGLEIKYTGGIFMFESILSKENVNFKNLEENPPKISYEYGKKQKLLLKLRKFEERKMIMR